MADSSAARVRVERAIERAEKELLQASHQLAEGFTREADRFMPPVSRDLERMVDDVFDVAERVLRSQRKLVGDVVRAVNEQADRAAAAGRKATAKKVPAKEAPARKSTAKKASARKAVAKGAAVKKAPARKASARKTSTR